MNSNIHQGLKRVWFGLVISFVFLLVFTEVLPWGHQMDMWVSHALFGELNYERQFSKRFELSA